MQKKLSKEYSKQVLLLQAELKNREETIQLLQQRLVSTKKLPTGDVSSDSTSTSSCDEELYQQLKGVSRRFVKKRASPMTTVCISSMPFFHFNINPFNEFHDLLFDRGVLEKRSPCRTQVQLTVQTHP